MIGQINQYTCQVCGGTITTIDRDQGVTPFMLSCQISGTCTGNMQSSYYLVNQSLTPTHEWYKPTDKVPKGFREYVRKGGLMLRKIGEE